MTERRAQDEKQNQRIFIKNKKQKSIQSHSRPNVCLIDFRACMKFIPRFKAFNHYKCDAMLCSSVCGSAVWRLMNEARDDVREKRENEKKTVLQMSFHTIAKFLNS